MLKLPIDVENPKEEPKAKFTFAKDESASFGAEFMRVNLAYPPDFDGD